MDNLTEKQNNLRKLQSKREQIVNDIVEAAISFQLDDEMSLLSGDEQWKQKSLQRIEEAIELQTQQIERLSG